MSDSSSSESSSDDESDEDEEPAPQLKKLSVASMQKNTQESDSSESDSDDESDEDSPVKAPVAAKKKEESSESSETESEDEDNNAKTVKPAKAAAPKNKEESSDSSESDSESDSDSDEPEKPTVAAKRPLATDKKNRQSSDESDDSSDESSEESDEEPPQKKPKPATKVSKKESSSDEDSEEESDKQAKTPNKKLAQNEAKTPAKSQTQSAGSKTIFVGNLSYSVDREQVKQFFEEAGEVVDVRLSTYEDGSMRGYGHVEFATAEAAQKALEFANHDLMGRLVRVDIAVERGAYTPGSGRDNSSFNKSAPRSGNTVFIKGFDTSSGEDQIRSALEKHFGSCGEIVRISIPKDYETGAPKGMAYMDFKDPDSLNKAYELNGTDLHGYNLYVDEAKPRPDNNRDGGFSGGRRGSFSGGRGRSDRGRGGRGRDGGRGRGFGGRGGRGDRGRGGRGTPYKQSAGTASTGKKTTFGDDE